MYKIYLFVPALLYLTWYQHSFMLPQMSGSPLIRSSSPLYKYISYFSAVMINCNNQNQFREERTCLGLCFQRDKSPSRWGSIIESNRHVKRSRELEDHIRHISHKVLHQEQVLQTVLTIVDQMFNYLSLWGYFYIN